MTPFPKIISALNVEASDCSGGLEQSTSVLLAELQGFVAQPFSCYFTDTSDHDPRQLLCCTLVVSAKSLQ